MDVSKNHPQYNLHLPYWEQIRKFVKGMKDVQEYLQPVTMDTSPEGIERNRMYKERASYTNFSARTRNAFVGSIFRKPAQFEIPTGLDYLIENANGSGTTLELLSKSVCTNLIEVGRVGLFVSAPNKKAKITTYTAENCKQWEVDDNGNLSHVELITGDKSEKHLTLINGIYTTRTYYDGELTETLEPTNFDGKKLNYIPFIFCGSTDNTPDVDDAPLWTIVDVSQKHYQNSADYEDIMRFMTPTPFVTVPNKSWLEEMLPDGSYKFGSGAVIPVPEGGSAGILQASENQMHSKAMEQKEAQLIALGARIISGTSGQAESEETVLIRYSSENSVLDNLVGNASQAINQCIVWCGLYNGVKGDVKYELNRDYFHTTVNPQQISADILLLDRGIVAVKDVRDNLRKKGYFQDGRDDDTIDSEIEVNAGGL